MPGVLLAHRGAVRVPKEALMQIEPPASTDTWKPVAHSVLVNTLTKVLSTRGIAVKKEEYAIQREGNLLFGVMDLAWGEAGDFYAALGLRTSNDKTFAIQIAIGARVVVCDNLLMSGELIALKRKHTAGLDLVGELTAGVRRYELGYQQLGKGLERLKQYEVSLTEVRELIFNVFTRKIVPLHLFLPIAGNYARNEDWPKPLSLWEVHNVFTCMLKRLTPAESGRRPDNERARPERRFLSPPRPTFLSHISSFPLVSFVSFAISLPPVKILNFFRQRDRTPILTRSSSLRFSTFIRANFTLLAVP